MAIKRVLCHCCVAHRASIGRPGGSKGTSATAVWRTVPRCGSECCMEQKIGPPLDAVIGTSRLGQTCVGAGGCVCGWAGNCPCLAAAIALRRVRPHVNQSYISLRLFTVRTQYLDLRCVLLSIRPRHVPYQESSILYSALHGWLFIMGHLSTGHLSIGHLSWDGTGSQHGWCLGQHVSDPACSVH